MCYKERDQREGTQLKRPFVMKCLLFILAKEGMDRRYRFSETFKRKNHLLRFGDPLEFEGIKDTLGFSLRASVATSEWRGST